LRPETSAFLGKAREFLEKAADMLADDWADEAGRAAYLAGLHAAQALIVERTGRPIKRHRGVQNEFWRLTAAVPRFDHELRAFLGRTYNLKAIADYETGPGSEVTAEQAQEALSIARRFVDRVEQLLTDRAVGS
jgi:uncharacterized protein (UPF0332 family)